MEGYTLLNERVIPEIGCTGYLYHHDKSGADVLYLSNPDDSNKVFGITFNTPPEDNCGTPHIIEHTVLCGSDKYPLKEPFVQLMKGSMNTFLNAMTGLDKTMYPVASQNEQDFMNLMDVYLDAVFHPVIRHDPRPFLQEGWHYEPNADYTSMTVKGIVYNEMKGAFSSPDEVLSSRIIRYLNPDTAYRFESGGEPDEIPELTYETYLDFYNRHYQASNSFIYFYGDGDRQKHLSWLDKNYLSKMTDAGFRYRAEVQKSFTGERVLRGTYAASRGDERPYFSYSAQFGSVTDPELYYAGSLLEYMLFDAEGAPLKEDLQRAGIGSDVEGFFQDTMISPVMAVIVKDADPDQEDAFVDTLKASLKKIVEEGFDPDLVEGAITREEFRLREANYGGLSAGLIYMLNAVNYWSYGADPMEALAFEPVIASLREKAKAGYFEKLVQDFLLDNPHSLIYTMEPDLELNAGKEQENARRLQEAWLSMKEEDRQALVQNYEALLDYQQTPDTETALSSIPILSKEDLDQVPDPLDYQVLETHGTETIVCTGRAKGITYLDLLFDMSAVSNEDLPLAVLFLETAGALDTASHSYHELENLVNIHTGGITMSLYFADSPSEDFSLPYRLYFRVRGRCLHDQVKEMLDLMREELFETVYDDDDRILTLLKETKLSMEDDFDTHGDQIARNRARAQISRSAACLEILQGAAYYDVLKYIVTHYDEQKEALKNRWRFFQQTLFTKQHLMISLTTDADQVLGTRLALSQWMKKLPESGEEKAAGRPGLMPGNVGYQTSSKVQYVAIAGTLDQPYSGRLAVLRSILSSDYLWDHIRVQGGAYGCRISFTRQGDGSIVSYRDPALEASLEVYEGIPQYLADIEIPQREMQKYIIGTISQLSQPETLSQKGARALSMHLNGITYETLCKQWQEVLETTEDDIRTLAPVMEQMIGQHHICVVGGAEKIEENKDLFDQILTLG